MKFGSKIIGLAVGQKSLLLAEVTPKGDRNSVYRVAEFTFPDGLSLATPEKLGTALGQFIKSRRFSSRDVVIGLPAKRLLTRRKEVPPAPTALAAAALRLEAEGEFSSDLDNLVMDFAGTPSTAEATTVLLMATNRDILSQCQTVAESAGLRVHGITSTTAALGRATSRLPGGDGWVLNLGDAGAEVVIQHGLDPAHIRHLNVADSASPESLGALAGEIRRMMASIPPNGTPMTLALWKGPSANGQSIPGNLLEQRLNIPVSTPELRSIITTDEPDADAYASAVAIAMSALEPAGLPVDFLHSRLEPPPPPRISNQKKIAIAVGIILAILVGGSYLHLTILDHELSTAKKKTVANKQALADAQKETKRLSEAQNWMPTGPHFINVLRDVTLLFPLQPNTIWVTRFNNNKNVWQVDGKASTDSYAQVLRSAMLARHDRFADVKLTYLQEDQTTRLWIFKLQFTYLGE